MNVKLTNGDITNLFQLLSNLKIRGNDKFIYAVAKNRSILKRWVEAIQREANSFADGSERFKEYQQKSDGLVRQFSVDSEGKPVMRDAGDGQSLQRVIPREKMSDFALARQNLDEEYKDVLMAAQMHQVAFQQYLRTEVDVDLHMIKMSDIPDEAKDTQYFNQLYLFVAEEEEVK